MFVQPVKQKGSRETSAVFQYLKGGGYRKAREGLFPRACSERTRGNDFKLKDLN